MVAMVVGMVLIWFCVVSPLVASICYKPITRKQKYLCITVAVVAPVILQLCLIKIFTWWS